MLPAVFAALKVRWEGAGKTEEGWLFSSGSREGHLNKDTVKDQHKKAIDRANAKAKAEGARNPLLPALHSEAHSLDPPCQLWL
jgi:hypothetical protein